MGITQFSAHLSEELEHLVPAEALRMMAEDDQKAIPAIAKDSNLTRQIEETV